MSNKYSDPKGTRFFYGKGEVHLFRLRCPFAQLLCREFLVYLSSKVEYFYRSYVLYVLLTNVFIVFWVLSS